MADVLNLSSSSTPDTGEGIKLKTGGRRKHNMPSKEVCAKKFGAGTKAYKDCVSYKLRGDKDYDDDYKRAQRMRQAEGPKPKKKKPKFTGGKPGMNY